LDTKPWTSLPLKTVAGEWTEVFCTHNEEPEEWKHIDEDLKDDYEKNARSEESMLLPRRKKPRRKTTQWHFLA
jgi:hypothetical protein